MTNEQKRVAAAAPAWTPADVDALTMAFPGNVSRLMPAYADIPDAFRSGNPWKRLASDWFFAGAKDVNFVPRPGIDANQALCHCATILRSFEPKHEHKVAAVGYLLSLWFENATVSQR